jgi:DNA polymerase III epsilon subunit-like protein
MNTCCFVDLETGGLEADKNGITEIAAVPFVIGTSESGLPFVQETGEPFHCLVKPEKWLTYSLGALSMQSGYRSMDQLIANGIPELKAYAGLLDFLCEHLGGESWIGRIWAHEAIFDWGFIKAMEDRHTEGGTIAMAQFGKRCDWSCSKFLYRRLAALGVVPDMEEVHLSTVAMHYGISFDVQHTALGDCHVGIQCLERIMQDEYHYYMKRPLDILDQHITLWTETKKDDEAEEAWSRDFVTAVGADNAPRIARADALRRLKFDLE